MLEYSTSSTTISLPEKTVTAAPVPFLDVKESYFSIGKRLVDLVCGFAGCLVLLALLPFIAAGIYFSAPGPLFFKQYRIGYRGRYFVCYKFRSMYVQNLESNKHLKVTVKGDPRVFRFGRFMRKTNLDELPQVFNVFLGDMSVVGPRPLPVAEHNYWELLIPGFRIRTSVKPGITGLAQALGLRGGTMDLAPMMVRFSKDVAYIRGYSLKLDLYIIWLTFKSMVFGKTNAH